MDDILIWLGVGMVVAVGLLLVADARKSMLGVVLTKPVASTLFIVVAVVCGAAHSTYGWLVLTALGLSWLGDAFLMPRSGPWFLMGLVAFLLGHVAYAASFVVRGTSLAWAGAALAGLAVAAVPVYRYLRPHLGRMRIPVIAYITVISVMVALAAGTLAHPGNRLILVGAVMFYLSDLAVARNRFVAPGFANRAWGLPLYYGSQFLLATTVGSPGVG